MTSDRALHIYEFDRGGTDWVAAENEGDAVAVMFIYLRETCGIDHAADEYGDSVPVLCPDDEITGFHHQDDAHDVAHLVGDGVHFECAAEGHGTCIVERRTYAEFAARNGRGFWATTER